MITAYFLGRLDGKVERYEMHRIDYDEAVRAHPDEWTLTQPANVQVIDKAPKPIILRKEEPAHLPVHQRTPNSPVLNFRSGRPVRSGEPLAGRVAGRRVDELRADELE